MGFCRYRTIWKSLQINLIIRLAKINANNVAERLRKMSIRFSLVVHTYNVLSLYMGLDLGWNKGPRDFSKFASCNFKGNNFNQILNILPYA